MRPSSRKRVNAPPAAKGETTIKKAFETSLGRFRAVFTSPSAAELIQLTTLLHRIRAGFVMPRQEIDGLTSPKRESNPGRATLRADLAQAPSLPATLERFHPA
jgi:hypothetical protein